ncbi:MAG: FAD binding domain-containing protein [Defluviicoccus sp.]|nr:FAD binding domain-containing protein [Defluviicoccus sp.]MDE0277012.1 FAD binding domain-containing protein [Defluviicoccus sp.]
MKPAPFTHHLPGTVDEAAALLAAHAAEDARILAGGQSLVPTMAFRLARPAHLIDINGISGLDGIAQNADSMSIGALARHCDFHRPVDDGPLGALLAAVVRHIGHYPIRMRGTFCGSLAHADPASEWCLVAAALDARLTARSVRGEREIAASAFFEWAMTTALAEDELLVRAALPRLAPDTRWGFHEFARRAGDFALAMALALYRVEDGAIVEPRVGLGGVEAFPRRIPEAEAVLAGKAPGPDLFREAGAAVSDAADAMADSHASAEYRSEIAAVMVERALADAAR